MHILGFVYNNKRREQVLLKLTSRYGVQNYVFILKLNEIYHSNKKLNV
jgi:hypothetical protein